MGLGRLAKLMSLIWAAYAGLVLLWRANGGSFAPGDFLAGLLLLSGCCTGLGTALLAGLFIMEMVRKDALKKWQALVAVWLSSVVSAIAPPIILLALSRSSDREAAGLNAALVAFVTFLSGVVAFVAFSIGVLCMRAMAGEDNGK